MNDRERELAEIFNGIDSLLRHKAEVPALDRVYDDPGVRDMEKKEKRATLGDFLGAFKLKFSTDAEPSKLASFLYMDFKSFLTKRAGEYKNLDAHGLAAVVVSLTLDDLADEAVRRMDEMEHALAYHTLGSEAYLDIERNIRKFDIMQMSAREARNLL